MTGARRLVALWAALAMACSGGVSGVTAPGHAVLFGLIRGPDGRPVSGALVRAALRGENCAEPDLGLVSVRTNSAGRYRGELSAPVELVGLTACLFVTITPPSSSGLLSRTIPSARVQVNSITQSADSVRVDAILSRPAGQPPGTP